MRHTTCPECGSSKYRNVAPESAHFVYDRICSDCETRYTPPTPRWMAAVGISAGLIILLVIAAFAWFAFRDVAAMPKDGDLVRLVVAAVIVSAMAVTAITAGFRHLASQNRQE